MKYTIVSMKLFSKLLCTYEKLLNLCALIIRERKNQKNKKQKLRKM